MNTCKTCRWWSGPGKIDSLERFGAAKCNHEKVGAMAETCFADGCGDAEGYGGVMTGPDFGNNILDSVDAGW